MSAVPPKVCCMAVCAVLFALAGCDGLPRFSMEKGCGPTRPCAAGYVCVDGFCLSEDYLADGDADVGDPVDTADDDNDDTTDTGDADDTIPVCEPGATRCMGDTVQRCENGAWQAAVDCARAFLQCRDGQCTAISVDGDDTDSDADTNIIDENCIPGQRRCYGEQVISCNEAGKWMIISDCEYGSLTCGEGRCVCPLRNRMCYENSKLLICHDGVWRLEDDCAGLGLVCVNGQCWDESGDALCPGGLFCQTVGFGQLANGCLNADGSVPDDNRDWCDPSGDEPQCYGNQMCMCLDESCLDARCIDMCGDCPTGQVCSPIGVPGLMGCLQDQNVPPDARWDCQNDADCPYSHHCHCLDEICSITVCLSYCSAPMP